MPLAKSCTIDFNFEKGRVDKNHGSLKDARSELGVLKVLSELRDKGETTYLSPRPFPEESGRSVTSMEYLPGIRMLDLLLTGERIARNSDGEFRVKLERWRDQIRQDSMRDLAIFQSEKIQKAISQELGDIVKPYDYTQRLEEAVKYVCMKMGKPYEGSSIEKEVRELADRVKAHPQTHFRDPILTNRIFCPENCEFLDDYMKERNQNTNRPWYQRLHEESLIKAIIESDALFEQLPTRTYNADFELTHSKVAVEDDWMHILVYEGVNLEPKEYLSVMMEKSGLTSEKVSETVALRSFREWARKLYYKLEHPDLFDKTFGNEKFTYMLDQSIQALERIRAHEGDNSFAHLRELFKECTTHADFYLVGLPGKVNKGTDYDSYVPG
jgi:hypothetical protein